MATAKNSHLETGAVRSTATQKKSYSRTVPSRKSGYTSPLQAISPVPRANSLQNRLQVFGRLKKKVRPDIYVPSDAEIKQLLSSVAGTDMELPVLLAAFGPMRRGEICALSSEDISGNIVHVCKNMVINGDRE